MGNNLRKYLRNCLGLVALLLATVLVTSCRSGEVDSMCLWGPIPDDAKLERLKKRGVKTIVNCRLNRLEGRERKARELGLNYEHIPTGLFGPPSDENINKFLAIIRNPDNCPIYICDQVARDRTQFYAAVYGMSAHQWSAEKASKAMYRNGLRHWWPWFYTYKPKVKEMEETIHNNGAVANAQAAVN